MSQAEAFARAAEALTGTPFRLQGRSRAHGLDCVGLVVLALGDCGIAPPPLPAYGLRNADYGYADRLAAACGFEPTRGTPARGDLLMVCPGPAQRHLMVAIAPDGVVHAHAGLRRVLRMPLPRDWPLAGHWRLKRKD